MASYCESTVQEPETKDEHTPFMSNMAENHDTAISRMNQSNTPKRTSKKNEMPKSNSGYKNWEQMRSKGSELTDITNFVENLDTDFSACDVTTADLNSRIAHPIQACTDVCINAKHVTQDKTCDTKNLDNVNDTQVAGDDDTRTFQQLVHDIEPSNGELGMLIDSANQRDLCDINPGEELFQSLPNLSYTVMDEEGNLVGSESNLLQSEVQLRNQGSSQEIINSCTTSNEPQVPTSNMGPLIDNGDIFHNDVIYANGGDGRLRHRAWSTSQVSTRSVGSKQPHRLGGRLSRYTWYRTPSKKRRLRRTTSSLGEESVTSFSLWNTSRREKTLLLSFAIMNLCSMMCISVMAPFFPIEADNEGVSATTVGWIFGSFSLAQLFFAPIMGKSLRWVDARFMFLAGQFFGGSCYALFGMVTFIDTTESNTLYIVYCFVLRISASLGCTASSTASFALTASTFRDQTTTVFGILETFCGLGLTLGPALGGALYDLGGFMWPFVVLGGAMVAAVPLNMYLVPHVSAEDEREGSQSMLNLLRIPSILVTCLCVAMGGLVWAMLDPILQPHLAQFDVSPSKVGLFFLLMCSFYAIFSPIWGRLCDHLNDSSPMMLAGLILSGIGLLLLGPSPVLGFPKGYGTLWLNVVALIVLGIAVSLAVIPTFDKMLDSAEKAGCEEGLELYGLIAGLWGAVYALGDFAGPTFGGYLTEKFDFVRCVEYVAYACGILAVIVLILWIWESVAGPCQMMGTSAHQKPATGVQCDNERQPLLSSMEQ